MRKRLKKHRVWGSIEEQPTNLPVQPVQPVQPVGVAENEHPRTWITDVSPTLPWAQETARITIASVIFSKNICKIRTWQAVVYLRQFVREGF